MRIKNLFIIAAAFILQATPLMADKEKDGCMVTGKIVEADGGKPLELANVVAADTTGKAVATAFTHGDGMFYLRLPEKTGDYTLKFTYMGYKTVSKEITHNGTADIDVGKVALAEGAALEGASITADQLLKKESDRIVYDVQADPDAPKMNMADFMEKIPDLTQNHSNRGRLSYKNTPIAEILIDDKVNGLVNKNRQYPMKFIQASYMSKIELILPGSPEYNNTEPILVVSLEEPFPVGFAAEISANANTRNSYGGSVDGVVNTPWFGIGVNYGLRYSHPRELKDSTFRELLGEESQFASLGSSSSSRSESLSHDLGMNVFRSFLDDKLDLQVSVNTRRSETDNYTRSMSATRSDAGDIVKTTSGDKTGHTLSPMRLNGGVSLSYDWSKRNSIDFRYTYDDDISRGNENMLYKSSGVATVNDDMKIMSVSGTREHDANLSLRMRDAKNGRWGMFATARYINRFYNNSTDYQIYDPESGTFISDAARYDGMRYRQQIATVRASFSGNFFRKKLGYSLGLNGEYLTNDGTFLSTDTPLDYDDWNLLPSVSVAFSHKMHRISASYRTSVRRPNMDMLNPYRDISDPENIRTGNPELKGEYTHSAGVGYTKDFRMKWFSSIDFSYEFSTTGNAIEQITDVNGENMSVITYKNLGGRSSHSFDLSASFRPIRRFSIKLGGGYTISEYEFSDGRRNRVGNFNASMMLFGSVKDWQFFLTTHIRPTITSAQMRTTVMEPYLHALVSKSFSKINLNVSLGIDDIMHGNGMKRSVIGSEDFTQTRLTQRLGRTFSLSISWQFGKFKKRSAVSISSYDM